LNKSVISRKIESYKFRFISASGTKPMDIESTKVTSEEIAQFRTELADNPKALSDLDVIEKCEGDLEQAARILARRADIEDVRAGITWEGDLEQAARILARRADIEDVRAGITWESVLKQARQVVCDDNFKESFAPDLIGGVIGALITSSNPVLVPVATPCAAYIVKVSLAKFCKINNW
jgi:hypothetical protein